MKDELTTDILKVLVTQEEIEQRVKELGEQLTERYAGKNPLFLGVLKGCFVFMSAIEGIKLAQSTKGEDIQKALFKVDFDAVTGHITFNETGDANKTEAFIKQATDGSFTFIKRQSVES